MTDQDLTKISEAPWAEYAQFTKESLDGTATDDFKVEDVALVIARSDPDPDNYGDTGAMVLQLMDGRFVSWESWTDCTGSSFHNDAYGGDAVVWFSASIEQATSPMSERTLDLIRGQLL